MVPVLVHGFVVVAAAGGVVEGPPPKLAVDDVQLVLMPTTTTTSDSIVHHCHYYYYYYQRTKEDIHFEPLPIDVSFVIDRRGVHISLKRKKRMKQQTLKQVRTNKYKTRF